MNWRTIGDTTYEAWMAEIKKRAPNSPLLAEGREMYDAARPHTRLALGMLWIEDQYQTDPSDKFPLSFHNAFNMKTPDGSGWMQFDSYAAAAKGWRERITSPTYKNGIYANTKTVAELVHVYAPAFDNNDEAEYVNTINVIVSNLPDQTDQPTDPGNGGTVALQIDKRLTSRSNGRLRDAKAWITIHGNGNDNSDRFDEASFVANGGGSERVLYTGAIDDGGTCFITPMDVKGQHSGNTEGNAVSAAFELCQGSNYAKLRENTAQTLAAIVLGDPRIDYGSFSKDNFSLDRVVEHRDWGRTVGIGDGVANGGCPAVVIANDGSIDAWILPRAREIVKAAQGGTNPTPTYAKPDTSWMKGKDTTLTLKVNGRNRKIPVFAVEREYEATKRTWRYQGPDTKGAKVGDMLEVGETFTGAYVAQVSPSSWRAITPAGSWILMNWLTPKLTVKAA